jgi:hypothetical protein
MKRSIGEFQLKTKTLFASFMIGMLFVAATVSMEAQATTTTGKDHIQVIR